MVYLGALDSCDIETGHSLDTPNRVSNLRPAWLTDDAQWREQLAAIPEDEANWLAEHWDLAGGPKPDIDRSWLTMENIDSGPHWYLLVLVGLPIVFGTAMALLDWLI